MNVKRSKHITPRRVSLGGPRGGKKQGTGDKQRLFVLISLAWLIGFSLYYYAFTLPNNHVGRFDILFNLPALLPVTELWSSKWANLGQRLDIAGVAVLILAGAWGLGQLAMRVIRPPIERPSAEHAFFAMALGLSAVGTLTLGCGLAGWLSRWLFVGVFTAAVVGELALRLHERFRPAVSEDRSASFPNTRERRPLLFWITLAVVIPFLFVMWLGAMTPDVDFDVGTYHFQGPKEYFLNGRITFLPHNVYTNFPFLTEMFALLGMVLHGDWYWGAVAGKTALFACGPLTALGLYAAGRRWFSPAAGLLAAMVYLTTPWIDRVSIIALAEGGLTFFLFATLFAVMLVVERLRDKLSPNRWVFMTGLLAGSGMACKYTGLMQVVLPAALALIAAPWLVSRGRANNEGEQPAEPDSTSAVRVDQGEVASPSAMPRRIALNLLIFAFGLSLTAGPWLLKNVLQTGNPVYPLAYSIFGGRGWSPELNAKFVPAHSPHEHGITGLWQELINVTADNDWSSSLLFGLAPLALLMPGGRRISVALWLFVGYLFVTYWAFTHRIDRFWMPLIPVVALLAGIGGAQSANRLWVWGGGVLIALAVCFNFGLEAGTQFCGHNAFCADRQEARKTAEAVRPYMTYLNATLPKGAKVLWVGDAEVFDARFPLVYNTVFNDSIFQEWFAAQTPGTSERNLPLKPTSEILAKLHAEGITHVFVNWDWIRHYHRPNDYGYTDFVSPERFSQLVVVGVLSPPMTLGMMSEAGMSEIEVAAYEIALPFSKKTDDGRAVEFVGRFGTLSDQDLAVLNQVSPSLMTHVGSRAVVINAQLFPVR